MEVKKNPKLDTSLQSPIFKSVGFVVALLLVISAFEFGSKDKQKEVVKDQEYVKSTTDEQIKEIPQTVQTPPPPVPVTPDPVIEEVPDDEEIKEEIKPKDVEDPVDIEVKNTSNATGSVDTNNFDHEEEEEEVDDNVEVTVAEKMASLPGGFQNYLKKNVKYPKQARRMNVQGKVVVSFVVEKDGRLTDVKVVRGIGSGCDEEALRVLKACPRWIPAEQRHKPVRLRMVVPVTFRLR